MKRNHDFAVLEQEYFETLKNKILSELKPGEHLYMTLAAEASQFIRVNGAKIRQSGLVNDGSLELTLLREAQPGQFQKATRALNLTGLSYEDQSRTREALSTLRNEVAQLPVDPYAEAPTNPGSSRAETQGELLSVDLAADELLNPAEGIDVAGIYASGPVVRAMANSAGLTHWFATETFSFDYSIYTPSQRALKGTYAGKQWNPAQYRRELDRANEQLRLLETPARRVERGAHRTYLAPAAVGDLVTMFSWGAISEASIRQGDSPLMKVRGGESSFSPKFSMEEDFRGGEVPRFNSLGELAPERLPLVSAGKLTNTLVSSRTAKEYGLTSNGASEGEGMRAPSLAGGTLEMDDILKRLGTGLYLSNLHYLNWSDQHAGRITGMTRYACFWVESGKIVAPIENLRFDDSIYSLFGGALEDLTRERSFLAETGTYGLRNLGGVWTPGLLLSEMKFTL